MCVRTASRGDVFWIWKVNSFACSLTGAIKVIHEPQSLGHCFYLIVFAMSWPLVEILITRHGMIEDARALSVVTCKSAGLMTDGVWDYLLLKRSFVRVLSWQEI